ncbi:MAG: DUF1588 domain-containing protein [Planctomycetaceae bacterium]|nr:DUF1588 domain-containing protein [Planctomycetaceae bacterium]
MKPMPYPLRSIRCIAMLLLTGLTSAGSADEFEQKLWPLLNERCVHCHCDAETSAGINFEQLTARSQWVGSPERIHRILKAVDNGAMPPEGEDALNDIQRSTAVGVLKAMLQEATADAGPPRQPLNRLNRFQYNNTVRDLFQLNRDVFALPEKLMTRYDDYLHRMQGDADNHELPEHVHVACHALAPPPALAGVKSFPKDLRAEHGFDNQADQLTLSPLLLDSFLQLSVSIVESPDFNAESVGVWNEFFAPPKAGVDPSNAVRERLASFLRRAFRGNLEKTTLDRYCEYVELQLERGLSFTDAMKKVTAAALSSPLFLYRSSTADGQHHQFALASRLSYSLWGSCPDDGLLDLAERGELSQTETLRRTIDRMLSDPKIERFLDSFPAQWMQLENLMAATPDPAINPYFTLDPQTPASLQMVLEPLLLFDAVFLEDRPIAELISPAFSYQSEFLTTWYHSELRPPGVDEAAIVAENQQRDQRRQQLQDRIQQQQQAVDAIETPVRERLLAVKQNRTESDAPQDLKPLAAWEFNGDLQDTVGGLHLTAHGDVSFSDGMVLLDKSYLLSEPLPVDLRAKSLEVRFRISNLDQRGGGLMGIQGRGDFFDTIVIGERQNRHWISGSNGFRRTLDFADSTEETATDEVIHLLMVYAEDGATTLYRNGQPYGKPFNQGRDTFPKETSAVIFGLRHLPAGGNRFLSVAIDQARLYDRALSREEAAAAAAGEASFIPTKDLVAAMTVEQRERRMELLEGVRVAREELAAVPQNVDLMQAREAARQQYEQDLRRQLRGREFRRVVLDDPRYGGIVTNAAVLSMTSGPKRTHPVARGVWITEVILNDPPAPPPNNVPPLNEEADDQNLTIRERFAAHRENPSCAGCHSKLDPLGFALENFDITGRWRDRYENGRDVDVAGTLMRRHAFADVVEFRKSLQSEQRRFAAALTAHLLRFALARELQPADVLVIDQILDRTAQDHYRLRSLIREVAMTMDSL